jgi:hypothetical protein
LKIGEIYAEYNLMLNSNTPFPFVASSSCLRAIVMLASSLGQHQNFDLRKERKTMWTMWEGVELQSQGQPHVWVAL